MRIFDYWLIFKRWKDGDCTACGKSKLFLGSSGLEVCPKCDIVPKYES